MPELPELFDILTLFGPVPPHGGEQGTAGLVALLTRHKISGAAALSTRALYHDAARGNRETRTACAEVSAPRLVPLTVLDPGGGGDTTGARFLAAFPATQGWPVRYAPLAAALRSSPAVPLLLEVGRPGDATDATALLRDTGFAGPVVLAGIKGAVGLSEALAVARDQERIHLATDGLRGLGEIETAVAALGARRIVFGSGAPRVSLGAALAIARQATLSDEDRALVLGGNARRLLQGGTE